MNTIILENSIEVTIDAELLKKLMCPLSGEPLVVENGQLRNQSGTQTYGVDGLGIPLFTQVASSESGRVQQSHYDRVAEAYSLNLSYPHTQEYNTYLDGALDRVVKNRELGEVAEICCGLGEAFRLYPDKMKNGVGVDISLAMLHKFKMEHEESSFHLVQGDATLLPLGSQQFDTVFMLGGIHHVSDRQKLFSEVQRILKPGGVFIFREPVSDFWLWKLIRKAIYKLSPLLDEDTERPLVWEETVPLLEDAGFKLDHWTTHGLLGFAIFMNSDILVFNRAFRFLPFIRPLTRLATKLDAWMLKWPGLGRKGLQVVGVAKAQ